MKRSSFYSLALAACALAGSVVGVLARPLVLAYHYVTGHVASACAMAAQTPKAKDRKPVWFVKPKAYASALAKRERPVLTSAWRLCPST